jgi:hypothetical protein
MGENRFCARPSRRSLACVVGVAVALVLAGCGSSGPSVSTSPSPLPSIPVSVGPSTISSAAAQAQKLLCAHLGDLQAVLTELQASPSPNLEDVTSKLQSVSTNLNSDATQLDNAGLTDAAAFARSAASAVDTLRTAVERSGNVPEMVRTAAAAASTILGQLPAGVCASPLPSASP